MGEATCGAVAAGAVAYVELAEGACTVGGCACHGSILQEKATW